MSSKIRVIYGLCVILLAMISVPSSAQTCVAPAAALNSTAISDGTADLAPSLATDGNGNWVAVWVENANVIERTGILAYARSVDDGITWGARATLPMVGFVISDPHITSDGANTFVVVYEARGGDGNTGVYSRRSTNDGVSWSSPITIDAIANTKNANPRVASDQQSSTFLVTWSSRNSLGGAIGDDADVLLARADFILQPGWSAPLPINGNAASDAVFDHDPDLATDGNGAWAVVWSEQSCSDFFGNIVCTTSNVRSAYSTDNGQTWVAEAEVEADAGAPAITWLPLTGAFAVAYSSDPSNEVDISIELGFPFPGSILWLIEQTLNPNAPYDAPPANGRDVDVQLAVDDDGNLMAVWQSNYVGEGLAGSDSEIFVARSYDGGITWTDQAYMNSSAFNDGNAEDAHPTIAVNPDTGRWVMAWESEAGVAGVGSDSDILFSSITAPTFYVDGNSDCVFCAGTSWSAPYLNLTAALSGADNAGGGVIKVADATYFPAEPEMGDPRDGTFRLPACTRIMGGYAGDDSGDPEFRDIDGLPTIISGERGSGDIMDNFYHVFTGDSSSREVVLSGLTITRGAANDGTDLDKSNGGGIFQRGGSIVIEACTIEDNLARVDGDGFWLEDIEKIFIRNSTLGVNNREGGWIAGPETVYISGLFEVNDDLVLFDTGIVKGEPLLPGAPGRIELGPNGRIVVNAGLEDDVSPSQSSIYIDRVTGSGMVQLNVGQGFVFSGELDLQGAAPPTATCDDPAAVAQWGTLVVLGEMLLDNALIEHVNILNFDDDEVPDDCGSYVGGTIVSLNESEIRDCAITVRGDRYFEFDPDEAPSVFTDSCLSVQSILPASFGEQGRLFEARSEDVTFVPDPMDPDAYPSGAFQLPPSDPGFNSIWTIDTLDVLNNGRVDIVNEEDYTMSPYPEAVYVRDLVLGDDAILNTGFQRVYYENLTMGVGAQIVDIPLLGFSLGVIDFENECDYDLRVDRNNNVSRIAIDDGFAMQMQAFQFGDAVAKGTFARAEGDSVLVAFNYRYTCLPVVPELLFFNVYLSDAPGVYQGQTIHLATITPPPEGRPGSITSGEFATFFGVFPRGDLDFTRGTYVELRLSGIFFGFDFGCVEIDNFDPAIQCTTTCRDLTGDNTYTNKDVLYQLAEIGQATNGGNYCLDHPSSSDVYGDLYDLLLVDGLQGRLSELSSCGLDLDMSPVAPQVPTLPAGSLVVAGKLATELQDDVLVPVNLDNTPAGPLQSAASRPGPAGVRGNHRIITDGDGELYQLNVVDGLIRLSDAAVVLGPEMQMVTVDGTPATVFVNPVPGIGDEFNGGALFDAAFDPSNPDIVYVGPVYVDLDDPTILCPYRSVARVDLSDATPAITHLYGESPQAAGTQPALGFNCDTFIFNPDLSHIREIEVDNDGHLLVAASNSLNNNQWLRIWDTTLGIHLHDVELGNLSAPIEAPRAMTWVPSSDGGTIFFGTALTTPGATDTQVVRYDLNVASPTPLSNPAIYSISDMRFVSSIVWDAASSSAIIIGMSRDDIPVEVDFDDQSAIFSTARIAVLPSRAVTVMASPLDVNGLALPLGAAIGPASACIAGDTNEDGSVTVADVPSFVGFVLSPPSAPAQRERVDVNNDNAVDSLDVAEFVQLLLSGGC